MTSWQNLRRGLLAHLAGDLDEAEARYRAALDDPATADAATHHLLRLLDGLGRFEEALVLREAAYAARPDDPATQLTLGTSLLAVGDFARGWPLFDARRRMPGSTVIRPDVAYPEWMGEPVRSLTVWDDEGAGDALQFIRFVPWLQARGIEVTVIARPALAPLFQEIGFRVASLHEPPTADAWVLLAALPWRLGVTLDDLPGPTPYLRPPAERRWRLPEELRLGVSVRGNPQHRNDANRSLPPEAATLVKTWPGRVLLDPELSGLPIRDFADTAAIISQLSVVVTVDTAVAHLAGAMNRPCCVLLPAQATDWRWMQRRTDSPWYPSVRLYRQPRPGDWASVLQAVAQDLPGLLQSAG